MDPGTYTLLVGLDEPDTVTFGAAGDRTLSAGYYAYTGSAFGSGGLSRVDRHRELAAGDRDVRHWHIDYLLGHPATSLLETYTVRREDRECEIARTLATELTPVPGLGASDCACDTHLVYDGDRERAAAAIANAY